MKAEKILLVENDPGYRDSVREFLEYHGYEVLVASDPDSAKAMMESDAPSRAVIDIRLLDNTDEKDESGLTLAKETDPSIPKIIMTDFPTYQAAREALKPSFNGLPAAVGFVAKTEGLYKLLAAIQLAGAHLNPRLEAHLLKSLGVRALVAIVSRMDEIGPAELARFYQESSEAAIRELCEQIKLVARQASKLHEGGKVCGWGAFALVLTAFMAGALKPGATAPVSAAAAAAGALSKIAGAFFYRRESEALKRLSALNEELRQVERERYLPLLCNAFEKAEDRDEYRKKFLDQFFQ